MGSDSLNEEKNDLRKKKSAKTRPERKRTKKHDRKRETGRDREEERGSPDGGKNFPERADRWADNLKVDSRISAVNQKPQNLGGSVTKGEIAAG
jgi:hypothetical protein